MLTTFYKNSGSISSRAYWMCRDREGCDARAITKHVGDPIVVYQGPEESEHQYGPIPDEVEAVKKMANLKRKAVENPEALPAQFMQTEFDNTDPRVLAKLPNRQNAAEAVRRVRLNELPQNPTDLRNLGDIPEMFRITN